MLVEVVRPYGGAEGKRVRVGQRFWVKQPGSGKKPAKDLIEITPTRFQQLLGNRLVVKVAAGDVQPGARSKVEREPRNRVAPEPRAKVLPDSQPPKAPPAASPKRAAKAQSPKSKPAAGSRPGGRTTDEGGLPSSSLAGRPTKPSTLKQRGVRRGDSPRGGSPSTTPGGSAPGQTSSTPATPGGGGTTTGQEDSTAFV